jgi:hemerythrin HHE cation binding domain-containing protein
MTGLLLIRESVEARQQIVGPTQSVKGDRDGWPVRRRLPSPPACDTVGPVALKRSRELKPLSSDHHQALLIAFQIKKSLAGHAEAAGAPKDLPGLLSLARRYEESVHKNHIRAEEECLGGYLAEGDARRLRGEHAEMTRLLGAARTAPPAEMRAALGGFADLLERHVHWEERELFPSCERDLDAEALALVGHELERRLVLAGAAKARRRA